VWTYLDRAGPVPGQGKLDEGHRFLGEIQSITAEPGNDFPKGHMVLSLLPIIQTPGKVQGSPTPSCNLHLPPFLIPQELIRKITT